METLEQILEIIDKPLALEARTGFQDRAVAGGLEPYVRAWARRAGAMAGSGAARALARLEGLFTGYPSLDSAGRRAAVEAARQALQGLRGRVGPARAPASPSPPTPPRPAPAKGSRPAAPAPPGAAPRLDMEAMYLAGIGPKRAAALRKLGVATVRDLLHYYPRDWQDRSHFTPVSGLKPGGQATLCGVVRGASTFRTRRGMSITEVAVQDATGLVTALYFNQPFQKKRFQEGAQVVLSGRAEFRSGRAQLLNPEAELLPEGEEQLIHTGRIVPLYPLVKELGQRPVRAAMAQALPAAADLPEHLPAAMLEELGFVPVSQALAELHFPPGMPEMLRARRRLAFDELFLISLGLALRKSGREQEPGWAFQGGGPLESGLLAGLPFQLTRAQGRVWKELQRDLSAPRPMHRLIQGDVGCGKTLLAAMACARACDNGFQAALMAPTEILAEQHLGTLRRIFDPLGLEVLRVVQGQKGGERREVLDHLASGRPLVAVGTHALIQRGVEFGRLGLAVVDEQHRFGVMQRLGLSRKARERPHVLVMTATPIPRTLAMTVYGDLDVSVVDELPPGRSPVATRWLKPARREEAFQAVRAELKRGRQAYVVYALVEESEKAEWKAATQMAEHLRREALAGFEVGLLHGRMEAEEKDRVMADFKAGRIQALASTTVIEVGVDVPNATVMLVEDADRFGLAQLHQLRGRVGRGTAQSLCFLVGDPRTEEGRRRLEVMAGTNDGFRIAEEDLKLRGPGEFLGLRQSGLPDLKLADLVRDQALLEEAKRRAEALIASDPKLGQAGHAALLRAVTERFAGKLELGEVG